MIFDIKHYSLLSWHISAEDKLHYLFWYLDLKY